jgi:hypothetical protein
MHRVHLRECGYPMQHEAMQQVLQQRPCCNSCQKRNQPFGAQPPVETQAGRQSQAGDDRRIDDEVGVVRSLAENHPPMSNTGGQRI